MSTLENLKVGDSVILHSGGGSKQRCKCIVSKVGKRHISIDDCAGKFRVSTGMESGAGYFKRYIEPYDEAKWQEYLTWQRRELMRSAVAAFDFLSCEIELIEQVYALLPKKAQP